MQGAKAVPLEDIVKYEEELLVAIVRHDLYWVWWRRSSLIVEGTKRCQHVVQPLAPLFLSHHRQLLQPPELPQDAISAAQVVALLRNGPE